MSPFCLIQLQLQHKASDFNRPLPKSSKVLTSVIWFQDWRVCCYSLLDCPDPKPVCWEAKTKTHISEKIACPLKCFPHSFIFIDPLLFALISMLSLCTSVEIWSHCAVSDSHYSATGSNIGTVFATDMDEKDSLNSRLHFQIQSQEPEFPSNNLFYIQQDTGTLQLTGRSLSKRESARYFLKVLVTDPRK